MCWFPADQTTPAVCNSCRGSVSCPSVLVAHPALLADIQAVDEMKKTQAKTASYVDKFSEDVRRQQSEAVARLRAQQTELFTTEPATYVPLLIRTSISNNTKADAALLAIRDEIAKTSKKEDHPLYHAQLGIFRSAEDLLELHTPLQDIIAAALKDTVNIGQDWDENGVDAISALNMLREDAEKTMEQLISPDTKGDKESPFWGQAVKMTSKNIRKALHHVPVLSEEEDKIM